MTQAGPSIYRRSGDGAAAGDAVPFFEDGTYHLFHLSCPGDSLGHQYPYRCETWQRHAQTSDLVHWDEKPTALKPTESYDSGGCWTGSMIRKDDTYFLFYTGHVVGAHNPQTICLATSRDMITFEKDRRNPLLTPDPTIFERIDFRDPYVFWNGDEGEYWMVIAARLAEGPIGRRGVIALATSKDLLNWTEPKPFYEPYSTFCPECPEMFKLGDWWYLVYSHFSESSRTTYRISKSSHGPWRTPDVPGVDGRRLYAAKTLGDGKGRRILWGSIYERVGLSNDSDWTYGGDFGVARELHSSENGTLLVSLPAEIAGAFKKAPRTLEPKMGDWHVSSGKSSVSAIASYAYALASIPGEGVTFVEFDLTLDEAGGEFGVLFDPTPDFSSAHGLQFDSQAQRVSMTLWPQPLDPFWAALTKAKTPPAQIDGPRLIERPLSIKQGGTHHVQIVIEDSKLDVFVDGKVSIAYRLYPAGDGDRTIGVYAQDSAISVSAFQVGTF